MSEALVTTLITYGPLGIAVVGLAYALALVYRNAGAERETHSKQVEALHLTHSTTINELNKRQSETVGELHKAHRAEITAMHENHTAALREVIENANKVAEGNTEYVEKLSSLIERLMPPVSGGTPVMGNPSVPKKGAR